MTKETESRLSVMEKMLRWTAGVMRFLRPTLVLPTYEKLDSSIGYVGEW